MNVVVSKSPVDHELTVNNAGSILTANENLENMHTLERYFIEGNDREMGNIVDTGKARIQNAILTAIDKNFTPRIELAVRSSNASSERDAISVTSNSEGGKRVKITASSEKIFKRNKTIHVLNTNDETRKFIPDEVRELSVPGTHFDRQPHPHHNGVFSVLNLPAKIDLVSLHSIFFPGLT